MDTSKLMRRNLLLYNGDVVSVLTVAKSSLRVYNITKDKFISEWIDSDKFKPLPLNLELVKELGFFIDRGSELIYKAETVRLYIEETQLGWELTIRTGSGTYFVLTIVKYYHELSNLLRAI